MVGLYPRALSEPLPVDDIYRNHVARALGFYIRIVLIIGSVISACILLALFAILAIVAPAGIVHGTLWTLLSFVFSCLFLPRGWQLPAYFPRHPPRFFRHYDLVSVIYLMAVWVYIILMPAPILVYPAFSVFATYQLMAMHVWARQPRTRGFLLMPFHLAAFCAISWTHYWLPLR